MQNLNKFSIQKLLFPAVCEAPVFGCFLFRCKIWIQVLFKNCFFQLFVRLGFLASFFFLMQNLSTGSIQKLLFPAVCEAPVFGCFLFRCKIWIQVLFKNCFFQPFVRFWFLAAFFSDAKSKYRFYSRVAFVSLLWGFGFWLLSFPMQNLYKILFKNCFCQPFAWFWFLAAFFSDAKSQ